MMLPGGVSSVALFTKAVVLMAVLICPLLLPKRFMDILVQALRLFVTIKII
jgi:hypothetical protein